MRHAPRAMLVSSLLLSVTGCVHAIEARLQSGFPSSGQWSGPVAPNDPHCGNRTTGLMTLGSKEFSFDPFGSVVVIQGKVEHDQLAGSVTEAAPGQQGVTIQFAGTITHPANGSPALLGTMTSGQCKWTVTLRRG